jgi:hypothetical protein
MTVSRVWMATLLSPLAWGLDLAGKVFLYRTANATGLRWPLHLLTVLALALTIVALLASRAHRRAAAALLERTTGDEHATVAAAHSMAGWGVALSLFFGLVIAAMAVPTFVFTPGDLP